MAIFGYLAIKKTRFARLRGGRLHGSAMLHVKSLMNKKNNNIGLSHSWLIVR